MALRVGFGLRITSSGVGSHLFCCRRQKSTQSASSSSSSSSSTASLDSVKYGLDAATYSGPYMKLLLEGIDVDFKAQVRDELLRIVPKRPKNFTAKPPPPHDALESHRQALLLLRTIGTKRLVSFAEAQSTPRHLNAFFEVLSTYSGALAVCAAEHFTCAAIAAKHAHPSIQARMLDGVDTFSTVCTVAVQEFAASEEPFNAEARWDISEQKFYLSGAAKTQVVNALSADWALVSATVTVGKDTNHGTQMFFVPLRDGGRLRDGVTIQPVNHENNATVHACGLGVIHFHNVVLQRENLFYHVEVSQMGDFSLRKGCQDVLPVQVVARQRRVATGSIYNGLLRRVLTTTSSYATSRLVVGAEGTRRHPLLGVQYVQTPVVSNLTQSLLCFIGWHDVSAKVCEPSRGVAPSAEDEVQLLGVVHFLQESLLDCNETALRLLGVYHDLDSSDFAEASTIVGLRREGVDSSRLIREVAYRSVTQHVGTTHWGWKLANIFYRIPWLDRLVKNPLYSPRLADLNRHFMFFSHKHTSLRQRLQRSRILERRKGLEHLWYDWNTFRHQQVVHCGEAFVEQYLLSVIMGLTATAYDQKGAKVLRDMGWAFTVARQAARLDYLLTTKMLSVSGGGAVLNHLDNLATVLAPHVSNLTALLAVPEDWRCRSVVEGYWTIPGTTTGVERGTTVTVVEEVSKADSHRKEDQEDLVEEEAEHDLLHGLGGDVKRRK